MSRTAVLALGGNALARADEPPTITNQFRHARESMAPIVELARDGLAASSLVHGNGPQVGDELARNEIARARASSRCRSVCWWPRRRAGSATCSSSRCRTRSPRRGCAATSSPL